jgi:TRAP-type C4-dicarboxylate transport system permease small subunit
MIDPPRGGQNDETSERQAPPLVDRLERGVVTLIFAAMLMIGTAQIVNRYAIPLPISRTEMLMPNMFIVLVFLSLAMTFRYRENINVSVLPDSLRGTVRRVYLVLIWLITSGLLLYLAYSAIKVAQFQIRIDAVTNVGLPAAWLTWSVTLGCVLSVVRIVQIEILPVWRGTR